MHIHILQLVTGIHLLKINNEWMLGMRYFKHHMTARSSCSRIAFHKHSSASSHSCTLPTTPTCICTQSFQQSESIHSSQTHWGCTLYSRRKLHFEASYKRQSTLKWYTCWHTSKQVRSWIRSQQIHKVFQNGRNMGNALKGNRTSAISSCSNNIRIITPYHVESFGQAILLSTDPLGPPIMHCIYCQAWTVPENSKHLNKLLENRH